MMIGTPGLPGLDLNGRVALRGPQNLGRLGRLGADRTASRTSSGSTGLVSVPTPPPAPTGSGSGYYSALESHPEVVAKAQTMMRAHGYPNAVCKETAEWAYNQNSFKRRCSPNGANTFEFDADLITRFTQQYEWDGLAAEVKTLTGSGPTVTVNAPVAPPPVSLISSDQTSTRTGTRNTTRTDKPQSAIMTVQPGEVPANTTTGTADKLAGGAADDKKEAEDAADEGGGFGDIFSASFKIGDVEIPIVLAIAAVGAAFMMSNKGGK